MFFFCKPTGNHLVLANSLSLLSLASISKKQAGVRASAFPSRFQRLTSVFSLFKSSPRLGRLESVNLLFLVTSCAEPRAFGSALSRQVCATFKGRSERREPKTAEGPGLVLCQMISARGPVGEAGWQCCACVWLQSFPEPPDCVSGGSPCQAPSLDVPN